MASFLLSHFFHPKTTSIQLKNKDNLLVFRTLATGSGRSQVPRDPSVPETYETRKKNSTENFKNLSEFKHGVENLGKKLKENMRPKQKGDWKDLVLMSLSFGVYVYISQKLVCAYCAWKSMFNHSW